MNKDDFKFLVSPFVDCYSHIKEDIKEAAPEFALWALFVFGFGLLIAWFVR